MHEDLSKEDLSKKMREKVEAELNTDGPGSVLIHNLENFAYRYLETSKNKNIRCKVEENLYWVESVEPDILECLKWNNKEVKSELIALCKNFPGQESKKIQVKLRLETKIKNNKAISLAEINWDFPNFVSKENCLVKQNVHEFEDLLDLRNRHAAWLEELTDLFI